MKLFLIAVLAIVPLIFGLEDKSSSVTTVKLVQRHGYPIEEHTVQTSDGYVLTMHRIPYSSRVNTPTPRPVAFMMHGLLCSSSDWILLGPDNGLAYMLSDAGYDVWMGNARGNTYSRKHVSKNPLLTPFWIFDWHEIGCYDLSAMIDNVLFKTGQSQVTYFGHSQGTTSFFVLNSLHPSFASKIRSAHLLAPVAYMHNMESPLAKLSAPILGNPNYAVEIFGSAEFLPNSKGMEMLGYTACMDKSPVQVMCSNALFLIAGKDSENLNTTLIPDIMATTPAGASINQIYHYLQEYNSAYFRQFDHGFIRNNDKYGQRSPPNYPLNSVRAPIYLYYGDNDYMAAVVDVHQLANELPQGSLKQLYRVPHDHWNHLDFLWGLNVKSLLYNQIMRNL